MAKLPRIMTHGGIGRALRAGTIDPQTGKLRIDREVFRQIYQANRLRRKK